MRKKGTFRSVVIRDQPSGGAEHANPTGLHRDFSRPEVPTASRPLPSGRPRLNPIQPEQIDARMIDSLIEPESIDSTLRQAARPSAVLEALRSDARILEAKSVRFLPKLSGLRTLASLPGGLDRPRPGGRRPFGRTHGERDLARPRRFRVGTRRTQA